MTERNADGTFASAKTHVYQLEAGFSRFETGVRGSFDRIVLEAETPFETADHAVIQILDASPFARRVTAHENPPADTDPADTKEAE